MDKRTLVATGLLVWAGALQAHMWYLTSSDEYKRSEISKAGDDSRSWSVSLGGFFPQHQQRNDSNSDDSGGGKDHDDGR